MKFITYYDYLEYSQQNSSMSLAEEGEKYILDTKASKQVHSKQEEQNEYNANEKEIDNKHDKMFRSILSNKNEMSNFLNQFLGIHDKIKSENLQQCNTNFITRKFKEKKSDIIYRLKDKPIYFLVEHQSTINKNMPHRLYEYVGELIKLESIIQHTYLPEGLYPIVVPIVIYTGFRKWKSETNFSQKQFSVNFYEKYRISLEYNLVSVHDYTFEELLKNRTLFSDIMIIEKCNSREELNEQMRKIIKMVKTPEDMEKLVGIIKNILISIIGEEDVNKMLEIIDEEGDEKKMSPVQKMLFDLKEEGRKEGKAEGIKFNLSEVVKSMLQFGEQDEKILKYTGISKKELEDIKKMCLNTN